MPFQNSSVHGNPHVGSADLQSLQGRDGDSEFLLELKAYGVPELVGLTGLLLDDSEGLNV